MNDRSDYLINELKMILVKSLLKVKFVAVNLMIDTVKYIGEE